MWHRCPGTGDQDLCHHTEQGWTLAVLRVNQADTCADKKTRSLFALVLLCNLESKKSKNIEGEACDKKYHMCNAGGNCNPSAIFAILLAICAIHIHKVKKSLRRMWKAFLL